MPNGENLRPLILPLKGDNDNARPVRNVVSPPVRVESLMNSRNIGVPAQLNEGYMPYRPQMLMDNLPRP